MAEHHPRQRLDLDVAQRVLLVLREVAHLLLREADVVQVAGRQLRQAVADLGVRQAEVGAVPFVEADRHLPHRNIATRGNVGEDAFDRRADLRIVLGPCLGVAAALEVTCHGRSLLLTHKP